MKNKIDFRELLTDASTLAMSGEQFSQRESLSVVQLPGDASTRRYFRVGLGKESWVMMLMDSYERKTNNFLLMQSVLNRCGVAVPDVLADEPSKGAILLQDLGDKTMLHHLNAAMPEKIEMDYFRRAVDLLVELHAVEPNEEERQSIKGFGLAFDEDILNWEINFTIEHFFKNYLARALSPETENEIKRGFSAITRELALEPRVFTHRDFHSRNIMVDEKHAYTSIDFQDARMGLRQYDLASILRDSYYQLSEEKVYALVDYYIQRTSQRTGKKLDRSHFIRLFDLMSIQRNFKAIGSFASFYVRRGNARYLRFIGNTFENVRRNLAKFPEHEPLHQALFHWYYF
jgi:aminoglycoside/choline kinase family phosphotransferase